MSDLGVLYTALRTALLDTSQGVPSWVDRAYADQAPPSVPGTQIVRPYVVYGYSAGGDESFLLKSDPNLLIDVIAVANTTTLAVQCAQEIKDRLDDQGSQDRKHSIFGDGSYYINTITCETRIHFVEQVDKGASQLFHSGNRYRVLMEINHA